MSERTSRFAAAILVAAVVHAAPHAYLRSVDAPMTGGMARTRHLLGDIGSLLAADDGEVGRADQAPIRSVEREVDRTIATIDRIVDQQRPLTPGPFGRAVLAATFGLGHDASTPCDEHAQLILPVPEWHNSTLNCTATVTIGGNIGSFSATFASGTTLNNIRLTINAFRDETGVSASFGAAFLQFTSVESGGDQFVSVQQTAGDEGCIVTLDEPGGEPAEIAFGHTGLPADLDCDDAVGPGDLALLLGQWGHCDYTCNADLDDSGYVSAPDLAILLANWTG